MEVWELKGSSALEQFIKKAPSGFVKLTASVMPKRAVSAVLMVVQIADLNNPMVEVTLVGTYRK